MDYLKSLDTFVRVAKSSSFSAAAVELGVSRAIITHRINTLEKRVGVQLFSRSTRRVALTEPGQRFYKSSARILGELADEELLLASQQTSASGTLRVAAPRSFGNLHLGTALAAFCLKHPEFHVKLMLTDYPSQDFDPGGEEFDLALELFAPTRVTLAGRKIASLRWAVCASPTYLGKHGTPQQPSDLAQHNCLLNSANFPDRFWRFGTLRRHRTINLKGNFSGTLIALRDAAIAGLGIALLPFYCAGEALRDGRLVHILQDHPLPDSPLYLLVPSNKYMPRKVRMLSGFLAKWARGIK